MDRLAGRLARTLRRESDDATVVGLDDEAADQVFDALSSETTRTVLAACYGTPRTPGELADDTGTSLQNVSYHVEKLQRADLLEPVETRYASNGREATAYGPTRKATVVVAGEPSFTRRVRVAVRRLFAPLVVVALASAVVWQWSRGVEPLFGAMADPLPPQDAQRSVAAAFLFFLGGVVAVLVADRLGWLQGRAGSRDGRVAVLFGRHADRTRQHVYGALVVALVTPLVLAEPGGGGIGILQSLTGSFGLTVLAIPLSGAFLAAVGAIRNGGLVPCWALGCAPVAGVALFVALGFGSAIALVAIPLLAVAVYGLPPASAGYLLGVRLNDDPAVRPTRRETVTLAAYVVVVVGILAALQFRIVVLTQAAVPAPV